MGVSIPFNPADLQKILGTSEGRQLLSLLNADGGKALREAAGALERGDQKAAEAVIAPMMQSETIQQLVKKLNKN